MHAHFIAAMAAEHRRDLHEQARVHRLARQAKARAPRASRRMGAAAGMPPEHLEGYGGVLLVRPIDGEDVDRLARLFRRLSPRSVYTRFFLPIRWLPAPTLERLADVDHDRREAIVAVAGDEIVAVARYEDVTATPDTTGRVAEVAVTVDDAWQHCGVGRTVATRLSRLAADRGFDAFVATVLPENSAALRLIHGLAPEAEVVLDDGRYEVTLQLVGSDRTCSTPG